MKISYCLGTIAVCAFLTGCAGMGGGPAANYVPPPPGQPPAAANDVIRVGDRITLRLEGVPDGGTVSEIQIPESGDITVALLTRSFHAVGRTTADLAAEITEAYKTDKIYTNPVVTIIPEERYVNVGGDVRSPTRVVYTPDLTLLSTIYSCGGFDEYADRHRVRITRGKDIIIVDCVLATNAANQDPPVYPGDQIYVPRTIF